MSSEPTNTEVTPRGPDPHAETPEGTQRVLVVTPSRCTGCRTCELTCAVAHGHHMKPARSRVRAYSLSEERNIPILCLQCEDAACVQACPVEALVRNERTGAIEVREDRCIQCLACVPACPFGNIAVDPSTEMVVKCDLCGGDPMCAKFCPEGALSFEPL